MRKILAANRSITGKKANIPTVLVIIIVIAFVMSAIIGLLSALVGRQFNAENDAAEYDKTNAVISIVETQGEKILTSIIPEEDVVWSDFVSNNEEEIISHINMVIPSDLKDHIENISVSYKEVVEQYVHNGSPNGYSCIVISFSVTENETVKNCNIGFFIKNAPEYSNEGADFEKGEYIFSWMS